MGMKYDRIVVGVPLTLEKLSAYQPVRHQLGSAVILNDSDVQRSDIKSLRERKDILYRFENDIDWSIARTAEHTLPSSKYADGVLSNQPQIQNTKPKYVEEQRRYAMICTYVIQEFHSSNKPISSPAHYCHLSSSF